MLLSEDGQMVLVSGLKLSKSRILFTIYSFVLIMGVFFLVLGIFFSNLIFSTSDPLFGGTFLQNIILGYLVDLDFNSVFAFPSVIDVNPAPSKKMKRGAYLLEGVSGQTNGL